MIHENYINYMNNTINDSHIKDKIHNNILDSLSLGDTIDKFMYSDQYWDLYLENGVNKCVYPSYWINKFSEFKLNNIEFNYSTLLSKSSQQYSCFKDLIELVNKTEYDLKTTIFLIENIIYNLFHEKGDKNIGIKLLINNNLNVENIDKLLKVCKIHKSYKIDYTCKYKTTLTKIYNSLI